MSEKAFGSCVRRLNAIWPRVQVHVRNVQSLSQHSSAQEDQRETHASARETRETHERQTRDRRETDERHPTFQAELEAETRGKCFPNETKSANFFEKNPPTFFFQPPPEKIAVSRCFLGVAPLSLVACLSLSLVVSRCLSLSPLVPALQDESHHQEVAEGSMFFSLISHQWVHLPRLWVSKVLFFPLNRSCLRYFTSNFTPKTTLLRGSMSFVIYGGAINGHGFHLASTVHPDFLLPPAPQSAPGDAQHRKIIFAHTAPMGPRTPIVDVKNHFSPRKCFFFLPCEEIRYPTA